MTKIVGAYDSVIKGVSEQVPQDRRSGQCWEQVNMVSNPVVGNARRHGSTLLSETTTTLASYATGVAETTKSRVTPFAVFGVGYDLIYRTQAGTDKNTLAWCFNRDTNTFVPIVYPASDPTITALVAGGVSSVVNAGRYLYIAGNAIVPAFTPTDTFGAAANANKFAVWVRGGAFARTFKIKIRKTDGTKLEAIYKTATSSYQTPLSTSDLLTSDPDYQKKVNDRVYAYNSAVTAWIGTAAADITPENIATKLAAAVTALGFSGVSVQAGTVTITNSTIAEITGDDGGDNTLLRAVGNELTAPELVSTIHYVGKIVKIKPQRSKGDDAFYLKAYAKNDGDTGYAEVAWREAAGYEMQPTTVFAVGTVVSGTLYIAGSPAALQTLSGVVTPDYLVNGVGDGITSILPSFFGQTISYLGLFQDRLVIASGAIVFMSRPGDYLNFWRQTVLSVIDTDPWEGFALGAESDTIRHSTTYDRDLVLFGDGHQFTISGRAVLTPKAPPSIGVASAYKDATDAAPVSQGNFVFYAGYAGTEDDPGEYRTTMHQVQAGVMAESPESFEFSQPLDTYIQGRPVEIVAMADPNVVLLRTDADRTNLYVYSYLDTSNGSERLADSWGRWNWDTQLGAVIGVSTHQGGILVYMLRVADGVTYVACERFLRTAALAGRPYLDSLRPIAGSTAPFLAGRTDNMFAAIGKGHAKRLLGTTYANRGNIAAAYPDAASYTFIGFGFPAYMTPTNPFRHSRDGTAIITGRLTLNRVQVSIADTSGLIVDVLVGSTTTTTLDFRGRVIGTFQSNVTEQPIVTTTISANIGKEIRECKYTLRAKEWLPLTVTAIDWSGQFFDNSKRVA